MLVDKFNMPIIKRDGKVKRFGHNFELFNKIQFHESQNPVTKFECVSVAPWDGKKLQLLGLD